MNVVDNEVDLKIKLNLSNFLEILLVELIVYLRGPKLKELVVMPLVKMLLK